MRSVHVHPCNIFLFWLDLVQRRCATPNCSLICSSKDHPQWGPLMPRFTKPPKERKTSISLTYWMHSRYIWIIGSDLSYLCLENTRGATQPRKSRKSCDSLRSLVLLVKIVVFWNELGFCPNRGVLWSFWWKLLFFEISWDFVPTPLADFHQRRFSVIISMLTKTKNLREEGERGVSLFIVDDFGD